MIPSVNFSNFYSFPTIGFLLVLSQALMRITSSFGDHFFLSLTVDASEDWLLKAGRSGDSRSMDSEPDRFTNPGVLNSPFWLVKRLTNPGEYDAIF